MSTHKTVELAENSWMLFEDTDGEWPSACFYDRSINFFPGIKYYGGSFAEYVCREYLRFIGEDSK